MAAKMDKEQDGSSYVRLQIAITDPVAVQKVLDKRYLTGSVGGRANKAVCSISGADLAKETEAGRPPLSKYRRGQVYKGKLAFVDMQDISFKEYSFVNQPADSKSSVRSVKGPNAGDVATTDGEWVAKSSAFVLHMNEEDIVSIEENQSVLTSLKKKESKPLYLHLKGSFLTALSIHESENYNNNNNSLLSDGDEKISTDSQEIKTMDNVETQEDILAVAEELSSDLSSIASESGEEQEQPKAEEQTNDPEGSEEVPAEDAAEKPEAEEKVLEDNSDKADVQAQEAVDSEKAEKSEEKSEETQAVSEEEKKEEPLNDNKEEVAETGDTTLLQKVKLLEEENAKLKKALHRTLVERVVDAKISAGVESADLREGLIEDHSARTASSLADSLRDLAKMPAVKVAMSSMPEITSETEVVEGENNVLTLDGKVKEEKEEKAPSVEEIFVDALMGRRKL
jgi:flagellar biosynthesis GTPase FlhF